MLLVVMVVGVLIPALPLRVHQVLQIQEMAVLAVSLQPMAVLEVQA
jgi:hypothetical protein